MSDKECPACGSVLQDGQLFCPACGAKMNFETIKRENKLNRAFESELFVADSRAEVCLTKEFTIFTTVNHYNNLKNCEVVYLDLIQKYPLEAKAYCAYVDFIIKYINKLDSLKVSTATSQIGDIDSILQRCSSYLEKAKQFADDTEIETILQLDILLSKKITNIESGDMKNKQLRLKKINKWCIVGLIVMFAILIIVYLIVR